MKLPIETPSLFGEWKYPPAKEIMEEQQDKGWTAQEIPVANDLQDYKHNLSPEQLNLASVTLQLFVEIEQRVGEVWDEIATWFPHSEIQGAAKEIARMESSVHAFFYQKMSDVMNIAPEEVAKNQETIQVLKSKLEFLTAITKNLSHDKPLSLATIALIEQVLLFSNFAMLKSFKSNGYNYIPNTITGVDFVIRDENIHGVFATYLHNTYVDEYSKYIAPFDRSTHLKNILQVVEEVIAHEDAIIDYTFPGSNPINDITPHQLKLFIRSRANHVLNELGYSDHYDIHTNPIGDWFYKGTKAIKVHDFFAGVTNQYRRSWSFDSFSRIPHMWPEYTDTMTVEQAEYILSRPAPEATIELIGGSHE